MIPPILAATGLTVSLMIAGPGDNLFSGVGHAFLRVEDPGSRSDYCFSYESESVRNRVLSFFAGRLKMGMYAVPSARYLENYEKEGRGVRQYRLDLPPDALERLWKILDLREKEGINLPYDYLVRGCARATLGFIREALGGRDLEIADVPELCGRTKRDLFFTAMPVREYPWSAVFLHTLFGANVDLVEDPCEVVTTPRDLVRLLRGAKVEGKPVIAGDGRELLAGPRARGEPPFVTPMKVAWAFVVLALVSCVLRRGVIDWFFLFVQSALGLALTYSIFLSDLSLTDWHWLFVPFNPLPLVLWKWRRKWAIWFAALLAAWIGFVVLYPHTLTDPAYVVLVGGYAAFYGAMGIRQRKSGNGR